MFLPFFLPRHFYRQILKFPFVAGKYKHRTKEKERHKIKSAVNLDVKCVRAQFLLAA